MILAVTKGIFGKKNHQQNQNQTKPNKSNNKSKKNKHLVTWSDPLIYESNWNEMLALDKKEQN